MCRTVLVIVAPLLGNPALIPGSPPDPGGDTVITEESDIGTILESVRRTQDADLAAWAHYRFRREVIQTRLDGEGSAKETTEMRFLVTPAADGFDELLTLLDGRTPSASEIERERKERRFSRRYSELLDEEARSGRAFNVRHILGRSGFIHDGFEVINGNRCRRLTFAATESSAEGLAAEIAAAMAGTLWVTVEGAHLVRAEARTVRPVWAAAHLVKIDLFDLRLKSQALESGVWLPVEIEARTDVRILGVHKRKHTVFRYSRFVAH